MHGIHGLANAIAGAFSGKTAREKTVTHRQRQITTLRHKFPHLYDAGVQLGNESKSSQSSSDHIKRRSARKQHLIINLSKEQINNHGSKEVTDELVDNLENSQLTFSALKGCKEKLEDLRLEMNASSLEELIGESRGKKSTIEEQVIEIKSNAYDFADMNNPQSAYLLTWDNSNHYALVIGDNIAAPLEGFTGENRFVNWQTKASGSVTSMMFEQAVNAEMTTLNGRDVSYTQQCHLSGKPTIFEFHGVSTSDMKKTWNQIQIKEKYQALSNDCTSVTARVLLSGLDQETKESIGAPRFGIWSGHNMEVLTSRLMKHSKGQELPESNAPLVDSVYEAADSLGLTQWLGKKAGRLYNKLTLETV